MSQDISKLDRRGNKLCRQHHPVLQRFPLSKYKFLKKGWNEYNDSRSSLSSLMKRNVTTPEGAYYKSIWERVVVPTIRLKYINISNLNNEIKDEFKSECQNIR